MLALCDRAGTLAIAPKVLRLGDEARPLADLSDFGAARPRTTAARLRARAGPILGLGWPLLLIAAVAWLLAPQDVALGDGGFILGQSHRVLLGQLPHADFISPRLAGSALIHTIDLLIPGPDFLVSRVLSIAQVVAYSICLGLLFMGARLREITVAAAAAIAASAVVNQHVFPAMAWHTIDGLFFAAIGFLLVDRGVREDRHRLVLFGALALGAAPIMKQSFALAPALGLARVATPLMLERTWGRACVLVESAVTMATPGIAYGALVAAGGGWSFMHHELGSARPVYGEPLIDVFEGPDGTTLRWIIVVGSVLFTLSRISSVGLFFGNALDNWLATTARVSLTALVVWIVLDGRLEFTTPWSFRLFWMAAAVTVLSSFVQRAPDFGGLVVCGLGWMVTLSWGLPWPAFVGGALALYVLVRTWQAVDLPGLPQLDRALSVLGVTAAVLVIASFWNTRSDEVFLGRRPTSVLTQSLDHVSGRLRWIKTDSATAAYLSWVKRCVARFPATRAAVVPEDALSGPVFGLRSPLPMDWLWPAEYQGDSRQRIIEEAKEVGREGDYLFLFQQVTVAELLALPPPARLPMARAGDEPRAFPYDPDLSAQIVGALHGRRMACGPFVGIYEPRST
jgi:hypothetical protein